MDHFTELLERALESKLTAISAENNPVLRNSDSVKLIRVSIHQLRAQVRAHPFRSLPEEIHYFKDLAPRLYGRLFYFLKVYQVELERRQSGPERMEVLLQQELKAIEQFFSRNADFCRYCYMQSTFMDEVLFTRREWENAILEDVQVIMETDYCLGTYWVARLRANEQLRRFLEEQLEALQNPPGSITLIKPVRKLKWTAGKTQLVELCEGIHLAGGFGKATLHEIMEWLGENIETDMGQDWF